MVIHGQAMILGKTPIIQTAARSALAIATTFHAKLPQSLASQNQHRAPPSQAFFLPSGMAEPPSLFLSQGLCGVGVWYHSV